MECPHVSCSRAGLLIKLGVGGPGVWLTLWAIDSSPPVIIESLVSSVIVSDHDVSSHRYTRELCCA